VKSPSTNMSTGLHADTLTQPAPTCELKGYRRATSLGYALFLHDAL
jgi:hypothetical protein